MMIVESRYKSRDHIYYILLLACLLVYRLFILFKYSAHYVDDDQALMWYGTADFAHFHIREPCFFGQAYGSMLESLLAVPLYWIGMPFNYALPLATTFLSTAPFIFLSTKSMVDKHNYFCSYFILFIAVSMSWQFDIITSVPRSLVPGFLFSVIGVVLIQEVESKGKQFTGALLVIIGFILTSTAISLLAIGYLTFLLYHSKDEINHAIKPFAFGTAAGVVLLYLVKRFYYVNPEYNLHPSPSFRICVETFRSNILCLNRIFDWFTFLSLGVIVIALILLILFLFALKKRFKAFALLLCAIGGTLFMFSAQSFDNYVEGSLLYGQLRMLVFIPYLVVSILYLLMYYEEIGSGIPRPIVPGKRVCVFVIAFILTLTPIGVKMYSIVVEMENSDSVLLNPAVVGLEDTSVVYRYASEVKELVQKNKCDVVIQINDNRCFGYACSAINYGDYIPYNSVYDRRTWLFQQLRGGDDYRCLLVDYSGCNGLFTQVVNVSNISVVDFLENTYSLNRRP